MPNFMKKLLLLFFLLTTCNAFAENKRLDTLTLKKVKVYKHKDFKFSYPKTWKLYKPKIRGGGITYTLVPKILVKQYRSTLSFPFEAPVKIVISERSYSGSSLEEIFDGLDQVKRDKNSALYTTKTTLKIDSNHYVETIYKGDNNRTDSLSLKEETRLIHYFLERNKLITLTYVVTQEQEGIFDENFDYVLQTFSFRDSRIKRNRY